MTPNKPRADWEAIERDYRTGNLSIRELAKQHGLSDTAIRKKAKEQIWDRDLAGKVRAKAQAQLVRVSVRDANQETERQTVDDAASQQVEVILSQRKMIGRLRSVALALLEELDEQTISRELYADLGEMLRSEDDKGQDKRNDLYRKLIAGAGRVDSVKKLSETLKIIIGLERQAFNISDEPPQPQDALTSLLDSIAQRTSRLPIKPENED